MGLKVDYAALLTGAGVLDASASWVEAAVEAHTRALARIEEHLAGSVTAGVVVDASRQLTDAGADLMPALQGLAQRLESFARACEKVDGDLSRVTGG